MRISGFDESVNCLVRILSARGDISPLARPCEVEGAGAETCRSTYMIYIRVNYTYSNIQFSVGRG